MKWLNLGLIRLSEFLVLLLYSFFVLTYFGAFLLLPLDVITLLTRGLGMMGLPSLVGFPIAAAVTAYLCYRVYKMPGLYRSIVNGGLELTNAGHAQLRQLEAIAAEVTGASSGTSPSTI